MGQFSMGEKTLVRTSVWAADSLCPWVDPHDHGKGRSSGAMPSVPESPQKKFLLPHIKTPSLAGIHTS
jgi:hypothetical protein